MWLIGCRLDKPEPSIYLPSTKASSLELLKALSVRECVCVIESVYVSVYVSVSVSVCSHKGILHTNMKACNL